MMMKCAKKDEERGAAIQTDKQVWFIDDLCPCNMRALMRLPSPRASRHLHNAMCVCGCGQGNHCPLAYRAHKRTQTEPTFETLHS